MKISRETRQQAKALFRACLVNGAMAEDRVRTVVQTVAQSKPRDYLALLTQFKKLVSLEIDRRSARVTSAQALEPSTQRSLEQQLKSRFGDSCQVQFVAEPGLIGGLRIRVGSDVWDGSVKNRLELLKSRL